ncbi:MAG: hypothetical protein ABI634_01295 [Acidobacteriota bacterium]
MDSGDWLPVTTGQTLRFFFETLKDVSEDSRPPTDELLYNASVLAHFATTSTASQADFPACPTGLSTIFDLFVLDHSQHHDPDIMEAAAAQCLLFTGFFHDQMKRRHNVEWYATLGAAFFAQAAHRRRDRVRAHMMDTMAARFDFWRRQQRRLAHELRDLPRLIRN